MIGYTSPVPLRRELQHLTNEHKLFNKLLSALHYAQQIPAALLSCAGRCAAANTWIRGDEERHYLRDRMSDASTANGLPRSSIVGGRYETDSGRLQRRPRGSLFELFVCHRANGKKRFDQS